MSKKDISYYINKDEKIITCKKRAKTLLSIAKEKQKKLSLTQCQNIAAQELGFKNWFDLHSSLKLKYSSHVQKEQIDLSKMFDDILLEALKNDSTDLHFELRDDKTTIKFRIKGEMYDYQSYESIEFRLFINYISEHIFNIKTNHLLNISSCVVEYILNNENIKILYQCLPVYPSGTDIILRIENINKRPLLSLSNMGYNTQQIEDLIHLTSKQTGGLLIGGNTASGKTQTAYTIIDDFSKKADYQHNIFTIEDENLVFKLSHVEQHVTKKYGYDLKEVVDSILQKNPKLLMIGDTNCPISFDVFTNAINKTSVISTFPINYAFGILDRLRDFNYHGEKINLNAIVCQKLLPIICPHCSISIQNIENNLPKFQDDLYLINTYKSIKKSYSHIDCSSIRFRNKKGCSHCQQIGITGRTVCCEIIPTDDNILRFIQENDLDGLKKYWANLSDNNPFSTNMRGKNARDHGIYKMLHGIICPLDIENHFIPF